MTIEVTFVIIISYSECFQILSIILTFLYPSWEYTWQINTFTFQRPSSSISRARGVSFTRHSCVWVVYLIHTEQSNGHIFGYGNEETRSYVYTTVASLRLIIIINNWPINHIVVWTIVSNKISFDTKKCIIWLQIMSFLIGRRP